MELSSGTSETDGSEFATTENDNAVDMLNSSLLQQNISPIKLHSQPQRQKVKQAKQKLSKAAQIFKLLLVQLASVYHQSR